MVCVAPTRDDSWNASRRWHATCCVVARGRVPHSGRCRAVTLLLLAREAGNLCSIVRRLLPQLPRLLAQRCLVGSQALDLAAELAGLSRLDGDCLLQLLLQRLHAALHLAACRARSAQL